MFYSVTGGRRRARPRLGGAKSARPASASSNALREGRADSHIRLHSLIATRTAVCAPRRVTICGPLLTQASSSSLKRAFASCTGQVIIAHPNN